jgi:alpha-amylase/alpha-mannosidase (GH57 family)
MNRLHLVIVWHMHQPEYRDPVSGAFVLPWTRLHALKDYWGMVKLLDEFPDIHLTVNLVPSLVCQLQQYASGQFHEPWCDLAFRPAAELDEESRREILRRAFHANRDRVINRWPRYRDLFEKVTRLGPSAALRLAIRDWLDLQVLSQLVWTDEEYLAQHPVVRGLSTKGAGFTEQDKEALKQVQAELLALVLPQYQRTAKRGQIEISTSPFYHPILPLLIHSDVAREANPQTRLLHPPFQHPEDAREQLLRARSLMESFLGAPPTGLWPSEGSVSDAVARMAASTGFRWLASDEGVLGKSLNIGFWRDAQGVPQNAHALYSPHRLRFEDGEISALFRDHFLSDLVGFVYGRMEPAAAADDLYHRLRFIGENVWLGRPLTVSLILDGENAWETYSENGRPFLREFYRRIQGDPDIRALTASEAIAAAGPCPVIDRLAAGSWINGNFDVWFADFEDLRAWELLRTAHEAYDTAVLRDSIPKPQLQGAWESLLVAEGSDWCWWYGPEHTSSDDVDFDSLFRIHLAQVYAALGVESPDSLAQPIKGKKKRGVLVSPSGYLAPLIDGRVSSYFEWIGAGQYAADRLGSALHGTTHFLRELHFGFDVEHLFIRVDPIPAALDALPECEFRVILHGAEELRIAIQLHARRLAGFSVAKNDRAISSDAVTVSFDRVLELSIGHTVIPWIEPRLKLSVALWNGGLPLDLLPPEGNLEILLGEENFAWAVPGPPPV